MYRIVSTPLTVAFCLPGLFCVLVLAGCAVNQGVSDAEFERVRQERRAQYDREQRERGKQRRERREASDWLDWIAEQQRPEGPVVLERGDLVLSAAVARAQHSGSTSTRITHLQMTEYARTLIADGNTERALDVLERAIAVDGSEGFAYLYLGYVYVHRGDLQRASGFLQQARRLLPPDPALRDELLWLDGLAAADPANSRGAER
jgi:Flp pilus assembly protein TadD